MISRRAIAAWNPGSASIGTDATAYSIDTQGSIATLECLQKPTTCTPPRAADPVYLNANWPGATVNEDWVTRIHLAAPDAKGSVERYAVTLVRKKPADDRNALCADSTGVLVYSAEAKEPQLKDGLCDPSLKPLP